MRFYIFYMRNCKVQVGRSYGGESYWLRRSDQDGESNFCKPARPAGHVKETEMLADFVF